MPPWQGGGGMIERVSFEGTTFAPPPARFEAGTPPISQAIGLGAAIDYLQTLAGESLARHELELLSSATTQVGQLPGIRKPKSWDVVVFIWPKDRTKDFIKRVIATEGQTVEVRDRHVFIDGKPWDDPHATWMTQQRTGPPGNGDRFRDG